MLVRDQQEVGMNGPTSLKLDIVLSIIDLLNIPIEKRIESLIIMKDCWNHFTIQNNKDYEEKKKFKDIQKKSIKENSHS